MEEHFSPKEEVASSNLVTNIYPYSSMDLEQLVSTQPVAGSSPASDTKWQCDRDGNVPDC